MAETTREMVVRLTMDAGGFKKTASEINRQIKNIDSEIKGMGGDPDKSKLEEKLSLQQKAVENLQKAVDAARTTLQGADTDAKKLLAAKQLSGLETELANAEAKAQALKNQLSAANLIKFGTLASNFGAAMVTMGRSFTLLVGGPLSMLGGKAYKNAMDYETALANLAVTAEMPKESMAGLDAQIKALTERIPMSYLEIAELMTTLARAGVAGDDLTKVVETMAALQATTDVSAEESAASLIKFMKNTNMSMDQTDELASVLFELGRAGVSTGAEIFGMAEKMAATGGLAGFAADDIFALSTAFSEMGIDAEAGGTSASKLMKRMQLAAETGKDVEEYTKVMGISVEQFTAAWSGNPAKTMLSFFESLSKGGVDKSVLANLEEMGLTEIRLSRLIAAGAANPELFQNLMNIADDAYKDTSGLLDATASLYDTSESRLKLNLNRIENTSADAGENIIDLVEPIIEKISELVGKFSELDEDTQTRWVKIAGALVLLGPAAVGIGNVAKGIGSLVTYAGKLKGGEVTLFSKLIGALKGPAGGWLLAAAGIGAVALAISSIKSPTEEIIEGLKNIVIGLDEDSYNATMAALAEVKAQADALSGETGDYNRNVSAAVKAGYGTADMYGTALGYEAMFTQNQITEIAGKYASEVDRLNGAIGAETDKGRQAALAEQRDAMLAQWDAETQAAKQAYVGSVSALVSGMMQAQPEAKAALEQAAQEYDLLVALMDVMDFAAESYDDDAVIKKWAAVFTPDVIEKYFPDMGEILPGRDALSLYETLLANMETALKASGGENSLAYTLWKSILDDPLASGLFDQTKTTGALDGIIELMDFKTAGEKAGMNFGDALTPGLADGIDGAAAPAVDAMDALEAQLVDKAAKMGAAVAAAFNSNVKFNLPNAGGGGVNVNVNSPTAVDIYNIRKGLTDASRRAARGYGAG